MKVDGMENKSAKLGQAAIENLVMIGFALAFILPIAFFFMSSTSSENTKTSLAQAKVTVRTIADEAGELYLQGDGAKKTIVVNYPDSVKGASVSRGVVALTLEPEAGRRLDVVSSSFAPIQAAENFAGSRNAGLQRIALEAKRDLNGDLYVEISYE